MKNKMLAAAFAAVLALGAVACSGGDDAGGAGDASEPAPATSE